MNSATFKTASPFFAFTKLLERNNNNLHFPRDAHRGNTARFSIIRCKHNHGSEFNLNSSTSKFNYEKSNLSAPCFAATETMASAATGDRLQLLVSEFQSLTEPIDRVKRLLDCAARLPPFDESARSPANRVTGCTTQVWLEAKMDEKGRMRFRADSDSEITKGFISCLIWLLDGAEPDEVVGVTAEDLAALNVGLYGKAQSRVNTWHNILIGMQNRTKTLVRKRKEKLPAEALPPLILSDGINSTGSFPEVEIEKSRWQELDSNLSRS